MISNDIKIFEDALGFIKSQKQTNRGEKISVEYLDIGNNVEIDNLAYIKGDLMFCNIHVRNVKEFHENSIIDVLKQLRKFIIDRTSTQEYSKPYHEVLQEINDSEILQIIILLFDPGYTGHVNTQEKKEGIKLNHMGTYYPEACFQDLSDKLQNNLSLKKLLLHPESVYPEFVLHNTDILNDALAKLKNQTNVMKRMNIVMNSILYGKQKLTVEHEGNTYQIPFEWFGPTPHIRLSHDVRRSYRVSGEVALYFKYGGDKDECGFEFRLPKELYDNVISDISIRIRFENKLKEAISKKFEKANITIHFTSQVYLVLLSN